jgi:hypothetical protein
MMDCIAFIVYIFKIIVFRITAFHFAFWTVSYVALSSALFLVFTLGCVAPHAV